MNLAKFAKKIVENVSIFSVNISYQNFRMKWWKLAKIAISLTVKIAISKHKIFGKKLAIIANFLSMRNCFWQNVKFWFCCFSSQIWTWKRLSRSAKSKGHKISCFKLCYLCTSVILQIIMSIWTLGDCCFRFSCT